MSGTELQKREAEREKSLSKLEGSFLKYLCSEKQSRLQDNSEEDLEKIQTEKKLEENKQAESSTVVSQNKNKFDNELKNLSNTKFISFEL